MFLPIVVLDILTLFFFIVQLNLRIPSMLIRRDGLMAEPYPMAHNFVKLMSARYVPPASGFTMSPLQQRDTMTERQAEGNKKELLPKASSDAGPGVGYAV